MTRFLQPLRSGQITIPADFRKQLGITQDTLLQLSLDDDEIRIKPVTVKNNTNHSSWMKDLYAQFAPIREDVKNNCSDKDIDTAIDEAVTAVRKNHAHRS